MRFYSMLGIIVSLALAVGLIEISDARINRITKETQELKSKIEEIDKGLGGIVSEVDMECNEYTHACWGKTTIDYGRIKDIRDKISLLEKYLNITYIPTDTDCQRTPAHYQAKKIKTIGVIDDTDLHSINITTSRRTK